LEIHSPKEQQDGNTSPWLIQVELPKKKLWQQASDEALEP